MNGSGPNTQPQSLVWNFKFAACRGCFWMIRTPRAYYDYSFCFYGLLCARQNYVTVKLLRSSGSISYSLCSSATTPRGQRFENQSALSLELLTHLDFSMYFNVFQSVISARNRSAWVSGWRKCKGPRVPFKIQTIENMVSKCLECKSRAQGQELHERRTSWEALPCQCLWWQMSGIEMHRAS